MCLCLCMFVRLCVCVCTRARACMRMCVDVLNSVMYSVSVRERRTISSSPQGHFSIIAQSRSHPIPNK